VGEQGRFVAQGAVMEGRRLVAKGSRAWTTFIASSNDADAAAHQEAGGTTRPEPVAA
jgi:hypothetical protein